MDSSKVLGQLPESLKDELLHAFKTIITNFREGKWEPSELNGGKLCEIIYSILDGYVKNAYPQKAFKPSNMVDACQSLSNAPATFSRSVRIQIPRMLVALYEVRNNRGVGHVGGEIDPNHMDATVVLYCSKWLMAELIRLFHNVDVTTATEVTENIIEKEIPIIWSVNDKKRVLNNKLTMKSKTLLLLYSETGPIKETDLVSWTEHTNPAIYRRDILVVGHKAKLWEYDRTTKEVTLSPLGMKDAEKLI